MILDLQAWVPGRELASASRESRIKNQKCEMALFSPKRTRTHRSAALRPSSTPSGRFDETFESRRVTLRILLCVLAVVGLLFAVQGWRAPFPYRLRDHAPHGITAKVTFRHLNKFETKRARQERKDEVPFYF